nr:amidase domain-containing protein [Caloramator sp. E03]
MNKYVWVNYNRKKAVEYADKYCGANFYIEDGYKYNKKYRNFADLGGDCANFASQVLSDKDAGGIKMGGGWLYINGQASASWVNAGAFTYHLLYSGKAKLISKGKYSKVINSIQYLSPGDIIAYQRKNDIVHVSIVTAIDTMMVPLVNSHTNDRYHVPWDLGWNSNDITFWLLKING